VKLESAINAHERWQLKSLCGTASRSTLSDWTELTCTNSSARVIAGLRFQLEITIPHVWNGQLLFCRMGRTLDIFWKLNFVSICLVKECKITVPRYKSATNDIYLSRWLYWPLKCKKRKHLGVSTLCPGLKLVREQSWKGSDCSLPDDVKTVEKACCRVYIIDLQVQWYV
jgi:hypothetical protein